MPKKIDEWERLVRDLENKRKKGVLNKKQTYRFGQLKGLIGGYKESDKYHRKTSSHLQKDINRLHKFIEGYRKMNDDRKILIKNFGKFHDKLLKEGRITKKEMKEFICRRKALTLNTREEK